MFSAQLGSHTESEILSQPEIWEKTLKGLVGETIFPPVDKQEYAQVIFTGCGSTFFLSQWAAHIYSRFHQVNVYALPASELMLYSDTWFRRADKTLLVATSRSAETLETIKAVEAFHALGNGDSIAVTCYPDRELGQKTDLLLATPHAQEESVVQTRSFTSMMLAIAALINGGVPEDVSSVLREVGAKRLKEFRSIAEELGKNLEIGRFFFLGSGARYGLANEAMLKMKEMSLSSSEAYSTLEIRHGPKSMVNQNSLVVCLLAQSKGVEYELRVIEEMKGLGARTLVITDADFPKKDHRFDYLVKLPSSLEHPWIEPLYLPGLQLMALEHAKAKGIDPDSPHNLDAVVRSI